MSDFLGDDERPLVDEFLARGLVRVPVEDRPALDRMQRALADLAAAELGEPAPGDAAAFLNRIHTRLTPAALNDFRLAMIAGLDALWFRPAYFGLGRRALEILAGNELVMQRRVNLSIQLPGDASSLLPIHSDVWSGDSPYEVVLWVPFVDCQRTKSIYFCEPAADREAQARLAAGASPEELYRAAGAGAPFIDVPYGQVLLFTQNLLHGNRVNEEDETRWSANCRFKSALSPYADKKLGEFFEPITLRPATRLGLRYRPPPGFDG